MAEIIANTGDSQLIEYSNGQNHLYDIDPSTGKKTHVGEEQYLKDWGHDPSVRESSTVAKETVTEDTMAKPEETFESTAETEKSKDVYDEFAEAARQGYEKGFKEWLQDKQKKEIAAWTTFVRPAGEAALSGLDQIFNGRENLRWMMQNEHGRSIVTNFMNSPAGKEAMTAASSAYGSEVDGMKQDAELYTSRRGEAQPTDDDIRKYVLDKLDRENLQASESQAAAAAEQVPPTDDETAAAGSTSDDAAVTEPASQAGQAGEAEQDTVASEATGLTSAVTASEAGDLESAASQDDVTETMPKDNVTEDSAGEASDQSKRLALIQKWNREDEDFFGENGPRNQDSTEQGAEKGSRFKRAMDKAREKARKGLLVAPVMWQTRTTKEVREAAEKEDKKKRNKWLVAGAAAIVAGGAAYLIDRYLFGGAHHNIIDVNTFHPDSFKGPTGADATHNMLHVFERNGYTVSGIDDPAKIAKLNHLLQQNGIDIASGMKKGPNGLEQNLVHWPNPGEQTVNAGASDLQGLPRVVDSTVPMFEKAAELAKQVGIEISK